MKSLWSRIWFPMVVAGTVTAQMAAFHEEVVTNDISICANVDSPAQDTVRYRHDGYKKGWTAEEMKMTAVIDDSLLAQDSMEFAEEEELDSMTLRFGPRPAGLDTLIAPDSLRLADTFRFRYYPATVDSACHAYVKDTLVAFGDSLDWPRIDSIFSAYMAAVEKERYDAWYATLDKKGKKKADLERMLPIRLAKLDSIKARKDSITAYKDSVTESTPRILETFAVKDTVTHQRIFTWTHDRDFHDLHIREQDTSYNYRIHDYPAFREDVNAVWLGVAGSPLMHYDFTKRKSREGVMFYDAQESWSYNPETLPMYNTKTPYTELAYWGTLISGTSKESDNLHILTTQNITPSLNFCLRYDRFGGEGMLLNEGTINKNTGAYVNYLGKRYLLHAGYIYNMVSREENGGVVDNFWIRDTTVDAREIGVRLATASSKMKKNTLFLDQQYRIPFTFIEKWKERKAGKALGEEGDDSGLPDLEAPESSEGEAGKANEETVKDKNAQADKTGEEAEHEGHDDAEGVEEPSDSTSRDEKDITTAFIGHSSEFSIYKRIYSDKLSEQAEKDFYDNVFNYNPAESHDSMRVSRFDNKVYIRLQPWKEDAIVSKLDVGVGEKIMKYATFNPTYLYKPSSQLWTSTYAYAGIQGVFRKFDWNAKGHYSLLGDEFGDFDLSADARMKFFPFRRDKSSPLLFGAHFETSLKEPEYYVQHIYTNHFAWDNDFGKISKTFVQGYFSVPKWKLDGQVGYTLLAGNIYFDEKGIVRRNETPMSILTASLRKDFSVSKFHFDHRILAQFSSNEEVVPLPLLSANLRYYVQLGVGDAKGGTVKPLYIQLGIDGWYNTAWYLPGWNPEIGVFHNQNEQKYGNTPYFDAFINMQWKRACIFLKAENVGMGVIPEKSDYFSANHYIRTQRTFKVGMFWPFYTQPGRAKGAVMGPDEHGHNH